MKRSDEIRKGLVEVFADIVKNSDKSLAEINKTLALGTTRLKLLISGDTTHVSVSRLIDYISLLGYKVEIMVNEC